MPLIEIPDSLCCCITNAMFQDPVVTRDGQSYERAAISEWFVEKKKMTSPRTNAVLKNRSFVTNYALKSEVERFKKSSLSEVGLTAAIKTGDLKTLETKPFLGLSHYSCWFQPLRVAVESNQLPVLKYLVQIFDYKYKKYDELLHHTANSSPEMVRYLVNDCKIPVDGQKLDGYPALFHIRRTLSTLITDRTLAVINELMVLGANPQFRTAQHTIFSGLHLTIDAVKLFVKYGAATSEILSYIDPDGKSILNIGWTGNAGLDMFRYYLSLFGSDAKRIEIVTNVSKDGRNIAHYSTASSQVLALVLAAPYNVNPAVCDAEGNNALHLWTKNGDDNAESLAILLKDGRCNIDATNKAGNTALHLAGINGRTQSMYLLLLAGANPRILVGKIGAIWRLEKPDLVKLLMLFLPSSPPSVPVPAVVNASAAGKRSNEADDDSKRPTKRQVTDSAKSTGDIVADLSSSSSSAAAAAACSSAAAAASCSSAAASS